MNVKMLKITQISCNPAGDITNFTSTRLNVSTIDICCILILKQAWWKFKSLSETINDPNNGTINPN